MKIYKDATIKELDNGYYEIDDGNVVTYGPKYITSDTIVTSYLPGKDGATNDAKVLVATMTGNNPPNSLVTIAKGDYDNVALDMLLNTTAAVEKATGKSAPIINGEAFSAHTGTQLTALNEYLKTHPNANVTYSCIDPTSGLNDAVYTEGWLEEHADLLKKYDVPSTSYLDHMIQLR